jgi:chorismate mutase
VSIAELRAEIDALDAELLDVLLWRVIIVRRIAALKAAGALPPRDEAREREILRTAVTRGERSGLDPVDVAAFMRAALNACRRVAHVKDDKIWATPQSVTRGR